MPGLGPGIHVSLTSSLSQKREWPGQARPRRLKERALPRRALGEDALERAAVHVETARRLRHVALAQFIDALDVLPAHAVRRHRMLRRLSLLALDREQRVD